MKIKKQQIHIWSGSLDYDEEKLNTFAETMSRDEMERARQLVNDTHQKYAIASRGLLRNTLSSYLNIPPRDIEFHYTEHQKPLLKDEQSQDIHFNISHSNNQLIIAICLQDAVGIDIEKIQDTFNPGIAKRYFSAKEQSVLNALNGKKQIDAFYQLWSNKEAVIKAIGKGLFINITDFSVPNIDSTDMVLVEGQNWHITPLNADSHYKAALAYAGDQKELLYYNL